MKILVVSDTHGYDENYYRILKMTNPDMVIHCGDTEGTERSLVQRTPCPIHIVRGNNDYCSELKKDDVFTICGQKIWVTHGHNYHVSMSNDYILAEAESRGVNVVCFGHTHVPGVSYGIGVVALNPGSVSYPRQDGRIPSYIIMEDDRFGDWHYTVAYFHRVK